MRTQLLPHNKAAYQKVIKAFEAADRTCVVHPTGTGKSYLIAAVSESYKNVLILGPNTFVLNQVHSVLEWRDRQKDGKVEYMTYSLLMFTENPQTNYDLICLDEFHRAGAPEWGDAVDRLLEVNPQAKVLGTTATPIRFLDDNRDMADELFEGNIASYMSLKDAWDRNILATPRFVTGLFEFDKVVNDMEERISKSRSLDEKEKKVRLTRVNNLRLDWERSQGMPAIIQKHIDEKARRVIVFCGNVEHLKDMEQTVKRWFLSAGFTIAEIYTVHGYMADKELKEQMDGFENDDYEQGIKIMLSVNMLNEGVHIPRINAVILLRTTSSKIIYLQQIGRCLTAANTDKPVILDMVDNITTTNLVHDIKEGFDWYAHQKLNSEEKEVKREPKDFVVYDYTLGIQQAIEKLVPKRELNHAPFEERLACVTAFCEQYGRLPTRKYDKDVFLHYLSLRQYYKDTEEVMALREKYGSVKTFDMRLERLQRFVDANGRLPKEKEEPEEYRNYFTLYYRHKANPDSRMQAILDKYVRKRPTDEELLRQFVGFEKEYNRLPRASNRNVPCWESSLRRHVRERLSAHPKVIELIEKYTQVVPFDKRMAQLKAFVEKNDRLPMRKDGNEEWNNLQQLRRINKKENNAELSQILAKYNMFRTDDELKQIIIEFYAEHGHLPRKCSSNKESALAKVFNARKSIHDDPEIAELLKTRRKQLPLEERVQILLDYTSEYKQRPSTSDVYMYNMWIRTVRKNSEDPRIAKMYEQYGGMPCTRMKEYIKPLSDFIHEHNRLPNRKKDLPEEFHLYGILINLRKNHANHPDVKPLLDEIDSWPSPGERRQLQNDEETKKNIISFVEKNGRLPKCDRKNNKSLEYSEYSLALQWRTRRDRLCKDDAYMQAIRDQYEKRPLKFEERYSYVRDWAAEHGRLPGVADKEVYHKWDTLRRNYNTTPEVQALMKKYGAKLPRPAIDIDSVLAEIKDWSDKHGRMPSSAAKERVEKKLGTRWVRIKRVYAYMPQVETLKEKFPIQNRM